MKGRRVCSKDGGKSPRGIASPSFKHGRYSRFVPRSLAPAMKAALNDVDLLSLTQDIATTEAMLDDLMRKLTERDPSSTFAKIRTLWNRLWVAVRSEDAALTQRIRSDMNELIVEGSEQALMVGRYIDLSELKVKQVDMEVRRREKMQSLVPAESVARDYRALALAVKSKVKDPEVVREIALEFERILGMDHLSGVESS